MRKMKRRVGERGKYQRQRKMKKKKGRCCSKLKEFFGAIYKKVAEADIEEFEAHCRGSDSEKKDLIDLYKKFKGQMNRLFCSMLCLDPKLGSHRFNDILDEAIAAGGLKATKAYQKLAKQVSETKPPTSPLKRMENIRSICNYISTLK